MRRILGFLGFILASLLSIYLFEWQHVWQFNADRVGLLRSVFYGCAAGALLALIIGRSRWLPAGLLALSFALAAGLSRAQFDMRTVGLEVAFVVGAWLCTILARPPLMRRGS